MKEERTLLAGIDFCNDYTQLSCFNRKNMQPDSMGLSADKKNYRIPTALVAKKNTREWLIGEDAVDWALANPSDKDSMLIEGLVGRAISGHGTTVFDRAYSPEALLSKFFKRILNILRQRFFGEGIAMLVVTTDGHNPSLNSAIERALASLGIENDRLRIITHLESFMHYTLNQSADIWVNDVALFDYTENGLCYYRLTFGRKQQPLVVAAEKTDLSADMDYGILKRLPPEKLAYSFECISGSLLHRQIISSIFVTGSGFDDGWADEVLKGLCVGRRVFRGQNLYTKGACLAAKEIFEDSSRDYILLDDEMLKNTISVQVYSDAQYHELVMANAGEHWQDAGKTIRVILDNTNEIDFIIRNVMKREPLCAIFTLEAPGNISDKRLELTLDLKFLNRDTAVITARDTGFGELRKQTYRIWEQILKL